MHCSKSLQGSKSAITMLPVSIESALTLFLLTQNFLRYSFHLFHLFILHFTYKFFIHFYFINAFFDWCFRLWFVSGRHYSLIVNFFSLLIEVDFRNKDFNQFRPKMLATNWNQGLKKNKKNKKKSCFAILFFLVKASLAFRDKTPEIGLHFS